MAERRAPRRISMTMLVSSTLAVAGTLTGCAFTGRVLPTPALTPPADPPAVTAWLDAPSWTFRGQLGRVLDYVCPPDGGLSPIWGTDVYTDDSSVCTAAVHVGYITREVGGQVRISILAGRDAYYGSLRNGVISDDYGPWAGSFAILAACRGSGCTPRS